MALAEAVLPATGLKPIVMIGDGGAMIGLLHLVHAAQLNVDVTVLVHNNFMFGMTGASIRPSHLSTGLRPLRRKETA
jgi:pyruvate/2-oxoacid:ferredoxin oxidoreductase beta subunit